MFKKNKFSVLAVSALSFLALSCQSDSSNFEEVVTPKPKLTNFKFLTINPQSIFGNDATLTHVSHEGVVTSDVYATANGATLTGNNPTELILIGDSLLMTRSGITSSGYTNCWIDILDAKTFKHINKIDLTYSAIKPQELSVNSCAYIGDGKIVTVGTLFYEVGGDGNNVSIVSLADGKVESSFRLDFPIRKVIYSGGKVIIAGIKSSGGSAKNAKIAIFDADDISESGLKILSEDTNLFATGSPTIVEDAKGRIWAAVYRGITPAVLCIDPKSEEIIHDIALPNTISNLTSVGIAVDNAAENVYIRAGRAFYHIDANNPKTPDDIVYEYIPTIVNGGMACFDLKMSEDDNLLFINQIQNEGEVSEVYEIDPKKWDVTNVYSTGIWSTYIYVAR